MGEVSMMNRCSVKVSKTSNGVACSVSSSSGLVVTIVVVLCLSSVTPSLLATPTSSYSPYSEPCFTRTLSPSTVKIKYGSLRGLVVHLSSPSSSSSPTSPYPRLAPVEAFLGVPYASPPTGALRFMPPVTPGHWRGTRLATRLAPACPQPPLTAPANATSSAHLEWLRRMTGRTTNQSEDCLYLNIYTPVVSIKILGKETGEAEKDIDETGEDVNDNEMMADEAEEMEEDVGDEDGVIVDNEENLAQRRDRRQSGLGPSFQRHRRHHSPSPPSSTSPSPSPSSVTQTQTSLPVVVLLSSPSYSTNLGALLDGSPLASFGQVLLVTLNYRLGLLGFLPAQVDGVVRGNHGLLDVVAALHWLQQNIAAFGGLPNNVTLVGHGHGAALAHILALSPMAKGLFSRVVLMSGSALAPWAIARDAPTYAKTVAKQLHCRTEPPAAMVECLRSASVSSLLSASVPVPEHLSAFGPSIDAIVMPTEPRVALTSALLNRGHRAANATHHRLHSHSQSSSSSPATPSLPSYLVGVTRVSCPSMFSSTEERTGLSPSRHDRILRTLVRNSFDYHQQAIFHTLMNEYTDWTRPVDSNARMDSLVELIGDANVAAPTTEAADHVAALSMQHGARHPHSPRTFFYVFSHQNPTPAPTYYSRLGAPPGTDLAYLLGVPLLPPSPSSPACSSSSLPRYPTLDITPTSFNHSHRDAQLAKEMIRYFTNFAANGDPNSPTSSPPSAHQRRLSALHFETVHSTPSSPTPATTSYYTSLTSAVHWPQYDTTTKKYIEFGTSITVRDHYRSHKLSIWLSLIPRLTIPSELEEKATVHGDEEDKEVEPHARRHHLLLEHGNPATFEGETKGEADEQRLARTNLSAPLDWHQAMLYGRIGQFKSRPGLEGKKAVSSGVPMAGKEQFAGRRVDEKRDQERDKEMSGANEREEAQMNLDLVNFTGPETNKDRFYESDTTDVYSTALLVTIVVGCSLLVLNVLVFFGVYCQIDGTQRRTKAESDGAKEAVLLNSDSSPENRSNVNQAHSQLLITSSSHNSSSVSYSVVGDGSEARKTSETRCSTLPGRRKDRATGLGTTSTLTRIRQNPREQYQLNNADKNDNQTQSFCYVHYPQPEQFEMATVLDPATVCCDPTHSAHCTPLKSILKQTTPSSLYDSSNNAQPQQYESLAIYEGTVHYLTPLDGAEYIDGGNFLTFLSPPPPDDQTMLT